MIIGSPTGGPLASCSEKLQRRDIIIKLLAKEPKSFHVSIFFFHIVEEWKAKKLSVHF